MQYQPIPQNPNVPMSPLQNAAPAGTYYHKAPPPVPKMGRPSKYTKKLVEDILGRLSEGQSLRTVCRDPLMPEMQTIWRWLREKPDFSEQYAKAKKDAAEALFEEVGEIAQATLAGIYDPRAAKVALDAYIWQASKLKPRKYGDKLDITTDGNSLPTPILLVPTPPAPEPRKKIDNNS